MKSINVLFVISIWLCFNSFSSFALADSTPINGACGNVNGVASTIEPTINLCSTGAATSVTGTGPWVWSCTGSNGGTTASCMSAPTQAVTVGYTTSTFYSTFNNDVDINNTQNPGYNWYLSQFFGSPATPGNSLIFNSDGSLTLTQSGSSYNSSILSATYSNNNSNHWVGSAYGGGAYIEAEFKFDPSTVVAAGGVGWPSWWAIPVEQGIFTDQWPGQASGYEHYIEVDTFEYDLWSFEPANYYGGTVHDWYGIYETTCPSSGFCQVSNDGGSDLPTNYDNSAIATPQGTDFTQYHKYGVLWVPATSTTQGYLQMYFDGVATTAKVMWTQLNNNDVPPPGTSPWTFGVVDNEHLLLILGTGANQPMTIKSVNIWQASAANNLITYLLSVSVVNSGGYGEVFSSDNIIHCGVNSSPPNNCSDTVNAGTTVTLTATPTAYSVFSGWSGACTGTGSCVVTMSAAQNVTATFSSISAPVNGVCGAADQTYLYSETSFGSNALCKAGTPDPLTVTFPALGSLVRWTCEGSNNGLNSTCKAQRNKEQLIKLL